MKNMDLGKDKIGKLILSFSIPCVISMLINSVYNIVDQIFIGKGVGTLGNGATNVIFPLVMMFGATAGLIGQGAAANFSLKLGEGKKDEASKSIGMSISLTLIVSTILAVISYILLPKLVYLFGCTDNIYEYAVSYGRIIVIGAPFSLCYSALSNVIRADGSPRYSMFMLIIGAVVNLILDPVFIFGFDMGVKGGALATIIGQIVSFIIAFSYIRNIKSVKLSKDDFKIDRSVFRILGLGLSSFITQCTVLVLFVFMNNVMIKYGSFSKFGADIPLSVYGVVSKINSLLISTILGISIGSQPIIGFNYGAGNYERVKETLKKVLTINFSVSIIFNIIFFFFPRYVVGAFVSSGDPSYELFMEFGELIFHSLFLICFINALEMTTSITLQSLGKVFKSTAVSFARQILLFIPIALLLAKVFDNGIYGILYAGPISDFLCFILCIFIFGSEYVKLSKRKDTVIIKKEYKNNNYKGPKMVITISREYGSGGRYVGELLAKKLGINFYDKEIISLAAKESGLSASYINEIDEQNKSSKYENNNDDRLFIAESKVIEKLYKKESFVIVGRCADYVLKDKRDVVKVFLYTNDNDKVNRSVKYYGLNSKNALKKINKINKDREKHYKYYTGRNWKDLSNYDLVVNVDCHGIDKTVDIISSYVYDNLKKK